MCKFMLVCVCAFVCLTVETEKRAEMREARVLCAHCSVTKWERNGTAGLKKSEDWISVKRGPPGQTGWEKKQGWSRKKEMDDVGKGEKSDKRP